MDNLGVPLLIYLGNGWKGRDQFAPDIDFFPCFVPESVFVHVFVHGGINRMIHPERLAIPTCCKKGGVPMHGSPVQDEFAKHLCPVIVAKSKRQKAPGRKLDTPGSCQWHCRSTTRRCCCRESKGPICKTSCIFSTGIYDAPVASVRRVSLPTNEAGAYACGILRR